MTKYFFIYYLDSYNNIWFQIVQIVSFAIHWQKEDACILNAPNVGMSSAVVAISLSWGEMWVILMLKNAYFDCYN